MKASQNENAVGRTQAPPPRPFVPYRRGALRGVCLEGYQGLDLVAIPWDQLRHRSDPNHELAKASRTRRVVRLEYAPDGQAPRGVYVKRVLVRSWRKRLGCLFVPSKARHEWRAGHRLQALGFATPQPVLFAERWAGLWLRANYLATEELDGAASLRQALEGAATRDERRVLLGGLARWLWEVHAQGFYHDDCSTQHVFVGAPAEPGRNGVVGWAVSLSTSTAEAAGVGQESRQPNRLSHFWFIDLDNCRFHWRAVPWHRRVKNLFQLLRSIPPRGAGRTDRLFFLQTYLAAAGAPERLRRTVGGIARLARRKRANVHLLVERPKDNCTVLRCRK